MDGIDLVGDTELTKPGLKKIPKLETGGPRKDDWLEVGFVEFGKLKLCVCVGGSVHKPLSVPTKTQLVQLFYILFQPGGHSSDHLVT